MSTKKQSLRDRKPPPPRILMVGLGVVLGFGWGTIMWGIFEIAGRESGAKGWAYIAITMAMIGGGVAAIFGAGGARRRGERITPKLSRKKGR